MSRTKRTATFVSVVVLLAVMLSLVVSRQWMDDSTVRTLGLGFMLGPSRPPPPAAPVSPGMTLQIADQAEVYNTGSCLNIRQHAGLSSSIVTCLGDGTVVAITSGPEDADGALWWEVDGEGWATSEYLRPAPQTSRRPG